MCLEPRATLQFFFLVVTLKSCLCLQFSDRQTTFFDIHDKLHSITIIQNNNQKQSNRENKYCLIKSIAKLLYGSLKEPASFLTFLIIE